MKTLESLIEMCGIFRALPEAQQEKHMAAYGRANIAIAQEMDRQACIALVADSSEADFLAMRIKLVDERMGIAHPIFSVEGAPFYER